ENRAADHAQRAFRDAGARGESTAAVGCKDGHAELDHQLGDRVLHELSTFSRLQHPERISGDRVDAPPSGMSLTLNLDGCLGSERNVASGEVLADPSAHVGGKSHSLPVRVGGAAQFYPVNPLTRSLSEQLSGTDGWAPHARNQTFRNGVQHALFHAQPER